MQNNAARVVCQATRRDSVKPLLQKLHWLPVEQRIQYKVSMLTFKALTMGAPMYLRDLLIIHEPSRVLRSAGSNRLVVPTTNNKTMLAGRAFQNYAPKLWNGLPSELRELANLYEQSSSVDNVPNTALFKNRLKTTLFTSAFVG